VEEGIPPTSGNASWAPTVHVRCGEPRKGFRPSRGPSECVFGRSRPDSRRRATHPGVSFVVRYGSLACPVGRAEATLAPKAQCPPVRKDRWPACAGATRVRVGRNGAERFIRRMGVRRLGPTRRTKHGAAFVSRDLEGEQSPGRIGSRHAGNGVPLPRTSRRSNALESRAATGARGSGELATVSRRSEREESAQRQEGNGHGDVVRLSRGNILRGVRTHVAGNMRVVPESPSGVTGPMCVKRGEPQDRQRDATSPRAVSGGTRRGGAKPRGRNGIDEGGTSLTEARRATSRGSGRSR
jgi:hypothetical protein